MQASEIIEELRSRHLAFEATGCHKIAQFFKETADLIEELQDKPWVESVQVNKLNQRIDELENEKTNLEAEIINFEIALDKAHCELVRCKDCKHYDGKWCLLLDMVNSDMGDWFCGYGKRKDDTL